MVVEWNQSYLSTFWLLFLFDFQMRESKCRLTDAALDFSEHDKEAR